MLLLNKPNRLLLTLLFILFGTPEANAGSRSFIWEVKSNTTKVYVHGSIHFAKPEIYPLPKVIEEGFAKSDSLKETEFCLVNISR